MASGIRAVCGPANGTGALRPLLGALLPPLFFISVCVLGLKNPSFLQRIGLEEVTEGAVKFTVLAGIAWAVLALVLTGWSAIPRLALPTLLLLLLGAGGVYVYRPQVAKLLQQPVAAESAGDSGTSADSAVTPTIPPGSPADPAAKP